MERRRKASVIKYGPPRKMRKVRISFSDPYATESSDDEGLDECTPQKIKRFVHEIIIPYPVCRNNSKRGRPKEDCHDKVKPSEKRSATKPPLLDSEKVMQILDKMKNTRSRPNKSSYRGVRQRTSGNFVAEIRDPFKGQRVWLGTFDTAEKASMAYEARRLEIEAKAMKMKMELETGMINSRVNNNDISNYASSSYQQQNNRHIVYDDSDIMLSHASPSSVLEVENNADVAPLKIDGLLQDVGNEKIVTKEELSPITDYMEEKSIFFDDPSGNFLHIFDDLPLFGFENDKFTELPDYDFDLDELGGWAGPSTPQQS